MKHEYAKLKKQALRVQNVANGGLERVRFTRVISARFEIVGAFLSDQINNRGWNQNSAARNPQRDPAFNFSTGRSALDVLASAAVVGLATFGTYTLARRRGKISGNFRAIGLLKRLTSEVSAGGFASAAARSPARPSCFL